VHLIKLAISSAFERTWRYRIVSYRIVILIGFFLEWLEEETWW